MSIPGRQVVFMTGACGSGKSSVARPLAAELGFALLSKDAIKEALYDAFAGAMGVPHDTLCDAADAALLAIAAGIGNVVLDANFSQREGAQLASLGRLAEVNCSCPLDVALRRFTGRAQARHPAHSSDATLESISEYAGPSGLSPVVTVDTEGAVDIGALAVRVRALLDGPP